MIIKSQENYETEVLKAYDLAIVGFHRAYAPYSNFRVGATLKIKESKELIFACNVENVSLGATICAERNAINQSIARFSANKVSDPKAKPIEIEFILVVADTITPTMPCGMCLQCMNEFSTKSTRIYLANLDGIFGETCMEQMLPAPFIKI